MNKITLVIILLLNLASCFSLDFAQNLLSVFTDKKKEETVFGSSMPEKQFYTSDK